MRHPTATPDNYARFIATNTAQAAPITALQLHVLLSSGLSGADVVQELNDRLESHPLPYLSLAEIFVDDRSGHIGDLVLVPDPTDLDTPPAQSRYARIADQDFHTDSDYVEVCDVAADPHSPDTPTVPVPVAYVLLSVDK